MPSVKWAVLGLALLLLGGGSAWAAVAEQGGVHVILTPDERIILTEFCGKDSIQDKTTQNMLDIIRDMAILQRDIPR